MADRVTIEAFSFITKMSATDVERSAESAFKTALTQLVVIFPVEEEQKNSILESVYFFSITLCNIPCFFALIGCRSFLQLLIMNLGNRKWTERLQSCWTCDHTYLRWEGKLQLLMQILSPGRSSAACEPPLVVTVWFCFLVCCVTQALQLANCCQSNRHQHDPADSWDEKEYLSYLP